MNKGILTTIGGAVLLSVGYGIWKYLDKKEEEAEKDLEETIEKVNKENPGLNTESDENEFLNKMMEEQKEAEEATKNWDKRNEEIQKELSEKKKSLNDQDVFTDDVTESSEFTAINEIRKSAGKEPMKMNENLEKFLGKDSESKSVKESLDNIAENIKKDPELKKRVLNILQE